MGHHGSSLTICINHDVTGYRLVKVQVRTGLVSLTNLLKTS